MDKTDTLPYFILKPTFDVIDKLLNIEGANITGLPGIPSNSQLEISDNSIYLKFKSIYNREWFHYLQDMLPEIHINSGNMDFVVPDKSSFFDSDNEIFGKEEQEFRILINCIYANEQKDDSSKYWRLVYPIKNAEWFQIINAGQYKDDFNSWQAFALLNVKIGDTEMNLYSKKHNEDNYMILESSDEIKLDEMIFRANCITASLGLILGKRFGNYRYIFSSKESTFEEIESFSLQRLEKSKKCSYQIFTTRKDCVREMLSRKPWQEYAKQEAFGDVDDKMFYDDNQMAPEVLSKLATLCYNKNDMYLATSMLVDGSTMSLEYQKLFYHIALETITSSFEQKGIPPMDLKEYRERVEPVLQDALNSISDLNEDARKVFSNRIKNNLNTNTNQDKLTYAFNLFGYSLSEEDKEAIKKRNRTFHGHISDVTKRLIDQKEEFFAMGLRLHKLCCILLLKASGFKGKILNNEVLYGLKDACERKESVYITL